jgi:hypothetical protein
MAVAIVAAYLSLQAVDTDAQLADVIPAAASVELAPSGALSTPARKESLAANPNAMAPSTKTRGLSLQTVQQRVSNKCRLANGSICTVRSQPVGSDCKCGSESGTIVD